MGREAIKDSNNHTLGYIEDLGGGKLKAVDDSNRTVGYYDPQSNNTVDANNRMIANGNVLSALIYKQPQSQFELEGGGPAKASADGRATKPASCSAVIGFVVLAGFFAIYNWWGERSNHDATTNSITNTDQVAVEADQSRSDSTSNVTASVNSANSTPNQSATLNHPQEEEVRGAILHALDAGKPVQWDVRGQSGWITVSAVMSTRIGKCRTVAVTDYQQRPLDRARTWCRRNGSDWEP